MRGGAGDGLTPIIGALGVSALLLILPKAGGTNVALSPKGILMLKKLEGFEAFPYQDIAGHWTVGYGTRISDPAPFADGVSEDMATKMMLEHVQRDIDALRPGGYGLKQNEIDALLILSYNVGANSVRNSRMYGHLKKGDINEAAKEWNWVNYRDPQTGQLTPSAGLIMRRTREIQTLIQGVYYA